MPPGGVPASRWQASASTSFLAAVTMRSARQSLPRLMPDRAWPRYSQVVPIR
jgi:hypothetical protein